jgi:hypothetical protein
VLSFPGCASPFKRGRRPKLKFMKYRIKYLVLATATLGIVASSLSRADTIVWDPDGSGNSPTLTMNSFQFGAGNSLFQGSIPFTQGDTFQLFFQAQLNSVVTNTGIQVTPIGLNASGAVGAVTPFEITVVGSVTESVTNINATNPPRTTFRVTGTQASNSFLELYYDTNQNANPLQGTGYNDGKLILRGMPFAPNPDVGTFSLTNPEPSASPNFDSFATNDYATAGPGNANITSILGIGATKMDVSVTFVDPAFFVAANGTGRQVKNGDILTFDISQSVPFDKVDPSRKFVAVANAGTASGPTPGATPRIGSNNGTTGPDFQSQSLIGAAVKLGLTVSPTPTPTPGGSPTPTPSVTPTPGGTPTPTPTGTPVGARVSVSANKTQVREGHDVVITFSLKGAVSHPSITVNYSVGGTATFGSDFTLSGAPGTVVIPSNSATATITLHANADAVKEPDGETARISVEPGTGYDVPTQQDAKRVSVLILDPGT